MKKVRVSFNHEEIEIILLWQQIAADNITMLISDDDLLDKLERYLEKMEEVSNDPSGMVIQC